MKDLDIEDRAFNKSLESYSQPHVDGVRMYPQQVEEEEESQSQQMGFKKVDPKEGEAKMAAKTAEEKAKQYKIEDDATAREIKKKFDTKTKILSEKYAQAYNGGVLHPDYDENEGVVAKEVKALKEEE